MTKQLATESKACFGPKLSCQDLTPFGGAIENVNRWLRRDLPRKVPLENYDPEDLEDALWLYNTTPRKCLGYRTPLEAFTEQLTAVAVAH